MQTGKAIIDLFDASGEVLESLTESANRDPPATAIAKLSPVKGSMLYEALSAIRISLGVSFPIDEVTSLRERVDDFRDCWDELFNAVGTKAGPKITEILITARSVMAQVFEQMEFRFFTRRAWSDEPLQKFILLLDEVRLQWARIVATQGNPELSESDLVRYEFRTPSGCVKTLNEYARTVIDVDHPNYQPIAGKIRLVGVDKTFVFATEKNDGQWDFLIKLLTTEEARVLKDGTVLREHGWIRIPKINGKNQLDCFRSGSKIYGPMAFMAHIVNYSAMNSAGGRTGRSSEDLFKLFGADGPSKNKDITERRNKTQKRLRAKLPHRTKRRKTT